MSRLLGGVGPVSRWWLRRRLLLFNKAADVCRRRTNEDGYDERPAEPPQQLLMFCGRTTTTMCPMTTACGRRSRLAGRLLDELDPGAETEFGVDVSQMG